MYAFRDKIKYRLLEPDESVLKPLATTGQLFTIKVLSGFIIEMPKEDSITIICMNTSGIDNFSIVPLSNFMIYYKGTVDAYLRLFYR